MVVVHLECAVFAAVWVASYFYGDGLPRQTNRGELNDNNTCLHHTPLWWQEVARSGNSATAGGGGMEHRATAGAADCWLLKYQYSPPLYPLPVLSSFFFTLFKPLKMFQ